MQLMVATRNRGKYLEIDEALRSLPLVLRFLGDFPRIPSAEEDLATFEANALKKARHIASLCGKATLADDSGLVVPSLDGEPGIHSARYAGADADDQTNREKLIEKIKLIPEANRKAEFVCVMALVTKEGREITFEGRCEGRLLLTPKGTMGFGYDPLFYIPDKNKTLAELSVKEKNRWSHRGQALEKVKEKIVAFLNGN